MKAEIAAVLAKSFRAHHDQHTSLTTETFEWCQRFPCVEYRYLICALEGQATQVEIGKMTGEGGWHRDEAQCLAHPAHVDLKADMVTLMAAFEREREEVRRLKHALEESVRLQSHYAESLNMYDGGSRIAFTDADDWIKRLAMTNTERIVDAARRWDRDALVARLVAKLRAIPDDDDAAIVALRDELLADLAPTPKPGGGE